MQFIMRDVDTFEIYVMMMMMMTMEKRKRDTPVFSLSFMLCLL